MEFVTQTPDKVVINEEQQTIMEQPRHDESQYYPREQEYKDVDVERAKEKKIRKKL